MRRWALGLTVVVALLHISGCASSSSQVVVKEDDLAALKASDAIVWGYIDSGTVHYVKIEEVPLVVKQGDQSKSTGPIPVVKPYRTVTYVPGLSKVFEGDRVQFVMLTFHNVKTGQDFAVRVGAKEGLQPFYVILPEGQYDLTTERFGGLTFETKSPKTLEVVGGKYAFYIGDFEMTVVNEEQMELHDYGRFQERLSEFLRSNPGFMGEIIERGMAHGEFMRGLLK